MIHQIDANFLLGFLDITLIEIALSGDNAIVIGMAAAKGNVALLVAGLFVSMPLLMTTGGFVALLIDRARWLIYIGAAAISFTAASMVLEDKALEPRLGLSPLLVNRDLHSRRPHPTDSLHRSRQTALKEEEAEPGRGTRMGRRRFDVKKGPRERASLKPKRRLRPLHSARTAR
jgi:hypothetical protein